MARSQVRFWQALVPLLSLLGLVVYGLVLRPLAWEQAPIPLELLFMAAAAIAITELLLLGYPWSELQSSISAKLSKAMPGFFILLAIGIIISSWIVSGTLPMLVFYGIRVIDPTFLYLLAFWISIVFSLLTGTSWGSAATIGVVLMGISATQGGHLGITAGAVIGGAYFGDKMSPLSDSTILAALAAEVDVYDHIRSMMFTTVPSALLASIAFLSCGFLYPAQQAAGASGAAEALLDSLSQIFRFNPLLLLPPLVVITGSIRKKPTLPTLIVSVFTACALALLFQGYSFDQILATLHRGFNADMAVWVDVVPPQTAQLLNRGGLYALIEPLTAAFMIFIFTGAIDRIQAMPVVVGRLLGFVHRRSGAILAALAATALTNSSTGNQYATSFIVADAFKRKFDDLGIARKVLSRSLEDTGTMLESIVPWTPTAIFMATTLGIPHSEYWRWQFLSLFNLLMAPALAILGLGCYYQQAGRPAAGQPASDGDSTS